MFKKLHSRKIIETTRSHVTRDDMVAEDSSSNKS